MAEHDTRSAPPATSPGTEDTRQDFDAYERTTDWDSRVPTSLEPPDLIGTLLADQRTLTAVEEFSTAHDANSLLDAEPAQSRYYSKLLPVTPPGPGQQYAFDVDLDRCSGCKACVTACHSLNGLDEHETWRDVGTLVGGDETNPLLQHVTTACHHCLDPGCLAGCPVDAYEKDPITGIVRHLDDQCFGCQYCTLTCPYEVPKYHAKKGIVRKCDMCSQRLGANEAPACVQACPHEAIAIRLVDVAKVRTDHTLVAGAPASAITRPTTTYRTRRPRLWNARPADVDTPQPQHAHVPLVVMLVLTQLAAGTFLVGQLLATFAPTSISDAFLRWNATLATGVLMAALGASTLHLGRPLYAFRGMLGWRHSWLSREILVFGAFAGLAVPFAASFWLPVLPDGLRRPLGWGVVGVGAIGVFCSVMIYVFTKREFWTFGRTGTRFLLTSLVLGLAGAWCVSTLVDPAGVRSLGVALIEAAVAKLVFDAAILRRYCPQRAGTLHRTASLMTGPLRHVTFTRFAAGIVGGVLIPTFVLLTTLSVTMPVLVGVAFGLCLLGELAERYLFFAAAAPPRMPGSVHT